jgi:integrase/recombinase XerC
MSDCRSDVVGLSAELEFCIIELATTITETTAARTESTWARFARFVSNSGVRSLADVTPELTSSFVRSRTSQDVQAGTATLHNRRTSLRLLFRTARRVGLVDGDPTLDLVLPPRVIGAFRPLADDEIALCRDAASWWMSSQRFAAVWALAEATARGGELGAVRVADVDLDGSTVWLSGGKRVAPRRAPLTNWGRAALERRIAAVDVGEYVAYQGASPRSGGRVSAASAVTAVLTRAGLHGEADIRPSSVAAWAGRSEFDRAGDIASTARLLGVRSLDTAARMIAWDWTR